MNFMKLLKRRVLRASALILCLQMLGTHAYAKGGLFERVTIFNICNVYSSLQTRFLGLLRVENAQRQLEAKNLVKKIVDGKFHLKSESGSAQDASFFRESDYRSFKNTTGVNEVKGHLKTLGFTEDNDLHVLDVPFGSTTLEMQIKVNYDVKYTPGAPIFIQDDRNDGVFTNSMGRGEQRGEFYYGRLPGTSTKTIKDIEVRFVNDGRWAI